ncbi:MAG: response regulator, partial [Rhodospirillales bacterium]|nr:response regulator [Rhodospirillales bacterium]
NLISNALKFTDTGHVHVVVAVSLRDDGLTGLRFTVHDTGIGITEEAKRRLFSAFSQADTSISRRFGGTGLGLAICRHLARLMGGDIGVESQPGRGSIFSFSAAFEAARAAAPQSPRRPTPPVLPPLTVLLAEDNAVNRKVAEGLLRKYGHNVISACDGAQAVDAVRRESFDVVLMDMQMPGMDGLEATRAIRAMGCGVPIIALTANAMAEDAERCREAGMNDYVSKPFTPNRLFSAIARTLAAQEAAAAEGRAISTLATLTSAS